MTTWIRQGAVTARFNVRDSSRDKTPGRMRFVLAGIGMALLLAGCGKSPEDQLLEAGRCVFAAIQLEDKALYRAATARMQQVAEVIRAKGGPGANAEAAARVDQKVMGEMTAHSKLADAMAMFQDWRKDASCKDMVAQYRKTQQ